MGTESEISVQYSSMSNSRKIDCTIKTGEFIGKVNLLMQEFYFAESKVKKSSSISLPPAFVVLL